MENKLEKGELLFKSSVKLSLYLILLLLFIILKILATSLGSYLSIAGWILFILYIISVFFVISTLKTIKIFSNGIELKQLLTQKITFYSYDKILDYYLKDLKENFIKMKNLNLSTKEKTITLSSFIYTKVDLIYVEIKKHIKKS